MTPDETPPPWIVVRGLSVDDPCTQGAGEAYVVQEFLPFWRGLTAAQKSVCDHFVYIPQHGNGTASLNVATATAIVLHHFAVWAGMPEQPREAGRDKFVVEPPPKFDGTLTVDQLALRESRKQRKDRAAAEAAAAAKARAEDAMAAVTPPVPLIAPA